jgi:hypothetical protein
MDFSKWRLEILHEIEYLVFHNYFVFFEKKKFFRNSEINVFRLDQFSLLMYRCLLPSSATVKMDYEENMENARYATNDGTLLQGRIQDFKGGHLKKLRRAEGGANILGLFHRGSQLYFHIARYMLKEKGGHFFCCPK